MPKVFQRSEVSKDVHKKIPDFSILDDYSSSTSSSTSTSSPTTTATELYCPTHHREQAKGCMCDKIDLKNLRLRNCLIYQNDWSFANITTLYVIIGTAEKNQN